MKKKHPNKHFLVRQERIRDLEYFLSVLIWSYKYQNTLPLPLRVEIEDRGEVSRSDSSEKFWKGISKIVFCLRTLTVMVRAGVFRQEVLSFS